MSGRSRPPSSAEDHGADPTAGALQRDAAALHDLVAEEERRAERIVSLVRIAVAIGLALVFNVAVRGTAPADDEMLVRQLLLARATMAGYAVIGVLSFVLSARRLHRRWFAFLFVTADVGFLLLSVDLALSNTALEPRFLVAMPSVWLVPAILAFGAMRYSPFVELYGTALLSAGLLWITAPDLFSPAAPGAVESALLAMFSDPANVMRVAMVALAGLVLTVAIWRARRLLTVAISRERRRSSLTKYLPPQVARLVETAEADDLRRGRRQRVVVMFVDIRGFTGRTETMAPEDVSRFLARFRRELREAADENGGLLDKFIGDGAIILFGVPRPDDDDAVRAVACAREILGRVEAWSAQLRVEGTMPVRVGIGMHAGEVFAGAVGDDARLEFTVVGDVVNVAARVEEMTRELESDLVVSTAVLEHAGDPGGDWRPVRAAQVRGRREPVSVWCYAPSTPGAGRPEDRSPA